MLELVSLFGNLIGVLVALIVVTTAYFKWTYQYWYRRNVPYLEPSIPFGNSTNPTKRTENVGFSLKRHYDKMKSRGWKHGGLFLMLSPRYLVVHLDYVKNILARDFQYFVDRGVYYNEKHDPLSANLFAVGGQKWRNLRTKLTPTFTSGKMKMMFQTLVDCAPNLLERIEADRVKAEPINIKEVLGCFTTDIIGSCAFGLDFNTFKEDNSPFREYGRKVFEMSPFQMLKMTLAMAFPNLSLTLGVSTTPKDVSDFFMKMVEDTVRFREENKFSRNDFMQLMIGLKNGDEGLTMEEVAAQAFIFFLAGFETSSTTMTFVLYELARKPEIQERARDEIRNVLGRHDQKITYDAINEMKYMDLVIDETLRMYPPVGFITRQCVKDYKVPDEDVVIEKGTNVMIPIVAIHYDEEYYPEPEKFDPDRFTEENKSKRHNYAHIPFGEGPRVCIGLRFGLMQTKVGLASLLRNYRFTVSEKTEDPLRMNPSAFILVAEGGIWLNAQKI